MYNNRDNINIILYLFIIYFFLDTTREASGSVYLYIFSFFHIPPSTFFMFFFIFCCIIHITFLCFIYIRLYRVLLPLSFKWYIYLQFFAFVCVCMSIYILYSYFILYYMLLVMRAWENFYFIISINCDDGVGFENGCWMGAFFLF